MFHDCITDKLKLLGDMISIVGGSTRPNDKDVPDNYNVETTTYDFAVTKDTTTEVTVKNTKEIVVPDTAMDAAVVYGIGVSIIIIGVSLIISAVKPQHDKKK